MPSPLKRHAAHLSLCQVSYSSSRLLARFGSSDLSAMKATDARSAYLSGLGRFSHEDNAATNVISQQVGRWFVDGLSLGTVVRPRSSAWLKQSERWPTATNHEPSFRQGYPSMERRLVTVAHRRGSVD